jgi:hypothetical protein
MVANVLIKLLSTVVFWSGECYHARHNSMKTQNRALISHAPVALHNRRRFGSHDHTHSTESDLRRRTFKLWANPTKWEQRVVKMMCPNPVHT